jgi:DNA-binding NarL/FixJ family response regulator
MSRNAVVVADDNAATCGEIVEWLKAHDVAAYSVSDSSVIELVQQVEARVVICRPGSTGIALFHALQEAADPPVVVLLSDAPSAKDEIYCNGRMLVTVIRMPVNTAALARFVKAVVSITARLDATALATLLDPAGEASPQAPDSTASSTMRFRVVH